MINSGEKNEWTASDERGSRSAYMALPESLTDDLSKCRAATAAVRDA